MKLLINEKIRLSINFGILLMGIGMLAIGGYEYFNGTFHNDIRIRIGACCIGVWYMTFPFIERDLKDNIMLIGGLNLVAIGIVTIIINYQLKYLIRNNEPGNLLSEILFCIAGILVFTYFSYIFVSVIQVIKSIWLSYKEFLFKRTNGDVSKLNKAFENATAIIIAVSTFTASMVGLSTIIIELATFWQQKFHYSK